MSKRRYLYITLLTLLTLLLVVPVALAQTPPDFWSLQGNSGTTPGTHFIGTTDEQALELHVNGTRTFRLEPAGRGGGVPNIVGGFPNNSVKNGVTGGVISGGGNASGNKNSVVDSFGVVGGGSSNKAGGGTQSTDDAGHATVAGGFNNKAGGAYSAIPGGSDNNSDGDYSLAAGRRAKANHDGSFVWADSEDADFSSTSEDQFLIRAANGVGIGTDDPQEALDVTGNVHASGSFVTGATTTYGDGSITMSPGTDLDIDSNTLFVDNANDRVGVGTNAPTEKMEIDGNLAITGTVDGSDVSDLQAAVDAHLAADTDTAPTNELNTSLALNDKTLELTDGGGTLSTDLSGLFPASGMPVAIHLDGSSGDTQYLIPQDKILVIENILFNDTWANDSSEPTLIWVQHSTNPSGPVWSTELRFFNRYNVLEDPLLIPGGPVVPNTGGTAVTMPFTGSALHKVFIYGRLIDKGAGIHTVIHLDGSSGDTQYMIPQDKMLIVDSILFNDTWANDTSEPTLIWVQHSTNPSGPVWSTELRFFSRYNLLEEPLIIPGDSSIPGSGLRKAVTMPYFNNSLYKVFIFGRLVDLGDYPPNY